MQLQLFYTLRSPYCYLAVPRLEAIERTFGLGFEIKHLHPHFVRDPDGVFGDTRPMRGSYAMKDVARLSDRLGLPLRLPRPDPVAQDAETSAFAVEQPNLHLLTRVIHLGVLSAEMGRGMQFIEEIGRLMWSGDTIGWHESANLGPALARAGLDLTAMDRRAHAERERIETQLAQNARDQLASGHWGTPLMVLDGEPFFGQDRIEDLVWRLQSKGAKRLVDA